MPPFIEFTGRNVEQAVASACSALKVPKEKLQHNIISFGASGIFGLVGVRKARIRVIVPDESETTAAENTSSQQEDISLRIADDTDIQIIAKSPDVPSCMSNESQTDLIDDFAERGRLVLDKLVNFLAPGADISVDMVDNQILYTVKGGNPALLIGKKGQTIEAVQYLLKKIVNKSQENRIRVLVDVEGYISKRYEALQKQALQLAEKACRNGKTVVSGKLSPQDRKIIHMALKDDDRVKTQSRGAGYLRNIIVQPQKSTLL